ncbi:DNA polymerase III subunit gamma/tau [Cerasicoccus arenae]|uniref:DNA polymerase III subunit gamma/tau n=1 Tax=Cerasicoccus arenae TaxID=424488 RepID=UPI001678C9DA|nr:DNA polymerase III subunit gamma/tau [Cerasicoccus arenae]MBK1857373.1 hypothetical protein [Cerasicoccus arenae]
MTDAAESKSLHVLEEAFAQGRLAHALLFQGASLETLDESCRALAKRLLGAKDAATHPDFFSVRPANKMRRIGVDEIRAVNRNIQQTANQGGRKVAVIYEADRLQLQAANAFLKTLEEPPADTTIFLLTTRPYDLLATIRSRCLLVNFPAEQDRIPSPEWREWLSDYGTLLELASRGANRSSAPELILGAYGLITRFVGIKDALASAAWKEFKKTLPETMTDEQIVAMETGYMKSLRGRMFAEIEEQTRNAALQSDDLATSGRRLDRAVQLLEKSAGLLEVNFQEPAALEYFLLSSLRVWARS